MSGNALNFQSPEQIVEGLKDTPRSELIEIIVSALTLEPLFSAAQVAKREGMNVRDVREEMKAGKMVHPLLGPGYFCRSPNSKKVAASAVNAWRRRFFVKVAMSGQSGNGRNGHAKQ